MSASKEYLKKWRKENKQHISLYNKKWRKNMKEL